MATLEDLKVAVLATDGVEQVELTGPTKALRQAKAEVVVVAPQDEEIQAMNRDPPVLVAMHVGPMAAGLVARLGAHWSG